MVTDICRGRLQVELREALQQQTATDFRLFTHGSVSRLLPRPSTVPTKYCFSPISTASPRRRLI
jgi:hypothetical protein